MLLDYSDCEQTLIVKRTRKETKMGKETRTGRASCTSASKRGAAGAGAKARRRGVKVCAEVSDSTYEFLKQQAERRGLAMEETAAALLGLLADKCGKVKRRRMPVGERTASGGTEQ